MKNEATNQFTRGLVMDLNPLVTPNNVLTDALNATLVTNNGNEGILLNDMGNGRVETAYLPEGYIPVGSCEFGDIIYIASYNPLINKCLLGCFPSPLRNISSSSISDPQQSLSWKDFQEFDEIEDADSQKESVLTGKIKANSVKKIVYKNNLTSGDKYIIAGDKITNENNHITDIGNTEHIKNNFPKLLNIKLVSIEEDGKITELTSGIKWYNESNNGLIDFFIKNGLLDRNSEEGVDIDEWRSAVNSAYCIFSSKVSGKLAILAELESITGFSCTWGVKTNLNPQSLVKINNVYYIVTDVELINSKTNEKYQFNDRNEVIVNGIFYKKENNKLISGSFNGSIELSIIDYDILNYDIYFLTNWETENNNINPKGIVLLESNWINESPKILLEKWNSNTLQFESIDPYNVEQEVSIQKSLTFDHNIDNNSNYYHKEYSLNYHPEDNITYSDYTENHEYSKVFSNTIDRLKETYTINELLKNDDIKFEKIFRDDEKEGEYYLNATDIDDDGNYLTTINNDKIKLNPVEISDDIVNNNWQYPIKKDFWNVNLPVSQNILINEQFNKRELDLSLCVYKYKIAPYMPYGVLEQYAQEGVIDFSKIGTQRINLNTWKYYNLPGYCTLTWGFEAYTEPDHIISRVVFEFYDNQGLAAALHVPNKESYNGVFTNYITFNNKGTYGLKNEDYNGIPIVHRGRDLSESELVYGKEYYTYTINKQSWDKPWNPIAIENTPQIVNENFRFDSNINYFENDAGILYSNYLYLVKIKVEYSKIGPIKNDFVETIEDYRWLWTTTLFNDKYLQYLDFKDVEFSLMLNPEMELRSNENWKIKLAKSDTININDYKENDPYPIYYTQLLVTSKDANLNLKIGAGFQNNHGVFSLKERTTNSNNEYNDDGIALINIKVNLGEEKITNSPDLPEIKFSNDDIKIPVVNILPNSVIGGNDDDKDFSGQLGTKFEPLNNIENGN